MRTFLAALAIALTVNAWLPAAAQTPPRRYLCDFAMGTGDRLAMEFIHEAGTERAFMIGNAGTSPVVPVEGALVVTFLELLATGAVQTTTIAPSGQAVHSRHSFMSGSQRFLQSQGTGACRQL